ncbi:MAG: hypothetical protein HYV07_13695 [Deltaproteobacteria bacterium]|nr:hypothetical protein [Deltaproteobacteria bacterium]
MNIRKQGTTTLDTDLLERLAFAQGSSGNISAKEAKSAIAAVKKDLKGDLKYTKGAAAYKRAEEAISKTFDLAIKSGWVKSATAQEAIQEFVKGTDSTDLKGTLAQIRENAKSAKPPRSGYSSYSGTRSGS